MSYRWVVYDVRCVIKFDRWSVKKYERKQCALKDPRRCDWGERVGGQHQSSRSMCLVTVYGSISSISIGRISLLYSSSISSRSRRLTTSPRAAREPLWWNQQHHILLQLVRGPHPPPQPCSSSWWIVNRTQGRSTSHPLPNWSSFLTCHNRLFKRFSRCWCLNLINLKLQA